MRVIVRPTEDVDTPKPAIICLHGYQQDKLARIFPQRLSTPRGAMSALNVKLPHGRTVTLSFAVLSVAIVQVRTRSR